MAGPLLDPGGLRPPPPTSPPSPTSDTAASVAAAALGTHAPRGWADLRKAVNEAVPTKIAHARMLNRAAHRKLTQRRRMG